MAEFPPAAFALAAKIEQMVTDAGSLTEAQIAERLEASGELPGPHTRFTLAEVLDQATKWLMPLTDGRWMSLLHLLRDRVFTHRIDEAELAHDVVRVDGDLSPLIALLDGGGARLADGTQVRDVFLPSDASLLSERGVPADVFDGAALLFEPGRLRAVGLGTGGILGMRLGAQGIELSAVGEDPAPAADLGRALAGILPVDSEPELYDTVMFTALADNAELLRTPAAPLDETVAALGYAHDGDWLAPPGFDFDDWGGAQGMEGLLDRYELDPDEAVAVAVVVDLYDHTAALFDAISAAEASGDEQQKAKLLAELDSVAAGGSSDADRSDLRDALDLLGEPAVASAVLAEAAVSRPDGAPALGLLADTLGPLAPRSARPALRWLQGKAYERLGAVADAEQAYLAAEDLDANWPLTLYELARFAADRGDAERGLGLLRRAGAPSDDPLVELLERFRPEPRTDLGRNDRCWCGSGRKYKQCHLHREQLPLDDRADWLYQKACIALHSSQARELLINLAAERSRFDDSEDALLKALDDPFTTDVALFEGRAFFDFLAARGQLLPEDERSLAEQWLHVARSVYEVSDVRPGAGFDVRDVRTGEVHEVRRTVDGRTPGVGDVICARIVPVGETMRIFGGAQQVPPLQRDELVALLGAEVNPFELVAFFARP